MLRPITRLLRRLPPWVEFSIVALIALVLVGLGSILVWASVVPIPSIDSFENRQVAQSTKIYDRTGSIVLYDVHGSMRRTSVPLSEISPYIQKATIATEDATFYTNAGFRPLSFARAAMYNIMTGRFAQGGSTITQQVVKNALLTQEKTIGRKLEEIILALRLTQRYTKDEILNTYLNETAYGGTIYGVEEASQYFFGVPSKDVDLAQAAYLAAIPQAPTYFSPHGNHKDDLDTRQKYVLRRMRELKVISEEEYTRAAAEEVQFKRASEAGIKAPHFVFFVREYLEEKYGADAVENAGLRVVTTLDYDLQKKAEEVVSKHGPGMATNFNASNTGMVAVDPKTGQILAMVGSRDYFNDDIDGQVNVTTSHRQPGSSFKPFVYAAAFEKGYTPSTVVFDLKTQFSTACNAADIMNEAPPCYSPNNYDGKFRGPITFRNALAQSINIPAVKALYLVGVKDAIKMAQNLGITTLGEAGRYGLTLVLGGGEVTLVDMTSAYSVFANDGVRNPPTGILEIKDSAGHALETFEEKPARVLEPQIARLVNDVLSDNAARTPEFGADSPLNFPGYDVADKTGTTNDYHDVWIVGYTPGIAVGAWAGNNDNSPMEKRIAAFIIAPMWHEFMDHALEKYSSRDDRFPAPAPDDGSLPPVLRGEWNTNPSQGVHEILYWVTKDNPRGARPVSPGIDPQFQHWEYPVQLWAQGIAPTEGGTGQGQTSGFQFTSPSIGALFSYGTPITITGSASNPSNVLSVSYFVNGSLIGTTGQPPYSVVYTPTSRGPIQLRAVIMHIDATTEEQRMTFVVQ